MKNEFVLSHMAHINVRETPNYETQISIRDFLINKQLPVKIASRIALGVKVNVNEAFIEDSEFFNKSVDDFTTAICNIYKAISEDYDVSENDIVEYFKGMSLDYNI